MVVSYTNACFGRWIANKGQASTLKANSKLNSKQLYNSLKHAEKISTKASQHVLDAFQNSLKDKIVLTCLPEKIIYETTGTFSFLLDICLPYSQLSSIFEETASLTRC